MRILMVTAMLPHREATNGGGLVMHGQLSALAARHKVTLATFTGDEPDGKKAIDDLRASGIEVHYVWRSRPTGVELWRRRWRDALGWLRGGRPLRTLQFYEPRMQYLLDELLSEPRFDLLQIEDNAILGTYRYRTQIPTVYTDHEVRSTVPSNRPCRRTREMIQWVLTEAERHRWQKYQSTVWRRFDRIQVFTPRDAAVIRTIAPELADRVRINPFGIEVPAEADPSREQTGRVVFVGGFGHSPNVDAALWLGNEIMPLLRKCCPGIRLILVGSYPPKAVQALASADTIVTGRVSMVEPFLEQAAVVIAPLRTGGGMRVKVLQAMALGKAVVTTPLGAEGLSVACSQPPLAMAETTEEIVRTTAALLASQAVRRTLGCRARAHIMQHYTWSAYGHRLEDIYAELPSEGRAK